MDPSRNFVPPPPMPPLQQFRTLQQQQQQQQFIPVPNPHCQPVGRGPAAAPGGLPAQPPPQRPQFLPPMQHLPARPGHVPPRPSQSIPLPAPNAQQPPPPVQTPNSYMPALSGPGLPVPSSYSFVPASSFNQPPSLSFNAAAAAASTQYQPTSQMHTPAIPPGGGQPSMSSVNQSTTAPVIPQQQNGEPSMATNAANVPATSDQLMIIEEPKTDWIEHTSANGRRYYYNKRTRQSSWEKPYELMTPIERADAATDWKEFNTPDGRKYYHNKVTKQSKWELPEVLKLARERVKMASIMGTQSDTSGNSNSLALIPPTLTSSSVEKTSSDADASFSGVPGAPLSPVPVAAGANLETQSASEASTLPTEASTVTSNADQHQTTADEVTATEVNNITALGDISGHDSNFTDKAPGQVKEEAEKELAVGEKVITVSFEEKATKQEPLTYADKLEAKNAFIALLESANVGSDWSWDQAMRVIINDKRYGALRTLGERKQAFNEFLGQKRKQDAEEKRIRLKKAREDFRNMLEESRELTSVARWSKAVTLFEHDDRFKAVERERERRDLFETYLQELVEKEQEKAQEERKQNILEYRKFLKSCDFIKAGTQWRKVKERLEADERSSRLSSIDQLENFQDYLVELEKEEEEQRKLQKEELRKAERKNRDEFRKLMERDVAAGTLTAKTLWRDYYLKVKDVPAYLAVASNISGPTPKDLFEDVTEELEKQYNEDRTRIKDAVKSKKIPLASTWTFEDFKAAVAEGVSSQPVSDASLKMVFDELLERAREKEEKEAKKHKRLADDFLGRLHSVKEITASSKWEDCKEHFEGGREFSSIGDESFCREIFEDYITQLKEESKENERRRKEEKAKKEKEREDRDRRQGKHRKEKKKGNERGKDQHNPEEADTDAGHLADESKKLESDDDKKQKRRHQNTEVDVNGSEKDRSKGSHRHSGEHRKSRRHAATPESDGESRHKRHKRDHRDGSRRSGNQEDIEDEEFGTDRDAR